MPSLFEVVALNEDGYENLPEPEVPYFVHAKEGDYLYKPTQIGNALVRQTYTDVQKHLGRIGFAGGVFTWKGDKVPANLIKQAHDFFLRIYQTKHSEAEVLITKHNDTGVFRLFVPFQRVSHMGVKSIYEPTHVSREYTVVGTMHSHCDFGAFHSGTDSGDASDMDGVHFTLGKVNSAPEIVAMVAMNGKEFHYTDPSDIADIDWTNPTTSPTWWDSYVFANGEEPKEKPRSLVSISQQDWNEFLGIALRKPKVQTHVVSSPTKWTPPQRPAGGWGSPLMGHGYSGNDGYDWRREVYGAGRLPDQLSSGNNIENDLISSMLDEAEKRGVFTDYDWDDIKASDMEEVDFWKGFFINRLNANLDILELLGIEFTFNRKKGKK